MSNLNDAKTRLQNIQSKLGPQPDAYKSFFSGQKPSGYTHLARSIGDTFGNILTFNYLNVANEILKIMHEEMEKIVPSGDEIDDAQRLQNSILLKLEKLSQDPEFQEKWKELSKSIATLLNLMINEFLDLVEEEGENIITKVGRVASKMLTNLASTGVDALQDAMSVVPGLDAVVALFTLFTSAITDGANAMLTALTIFNSAINFSEKLAEKMLGADSKALGIITEVQGFIDMIRSPNKDANLLANKLDAFNKVEPEAEPTQNPSQEESSANPGEGQPASPPETTPSNSVSPSAPAQETTSSESSAQKNTGIPQYPTLGPSTPAATPKETPSLKPVSRGGSRHKKSTRKYGKHGKKNKQGSRTTKHRSSKKRKRSHKK